jgi:hypothetical protein
MSPLPPSNRLNIALKRQGYTLMSSVTPGGEGTYKTRMVDLHILCLFSSQHIHKSPAQPPIDRIRCLLSLCLSTEKTHQKTKTATN